MNYVWSFPYISFDEVNTAFEIGSRDLYDACNIHRAFECKVYAFECNPDGIEECKKTKAMYPDDDVILIEKAISQTDGNISFHAFDKEKYDNIGASSLFAIDFISNRSENDMDYGKKDVQKLITVPSVRFDTFCKEKNVIPDAIFMDVQEAELEVLKSAGNILNKVKYIVTEVSTCPTYIGGCEITILNDFLESNGFELISHDKNIIKRTETFASIDVIYKNKHL